MLRIFGASDDLMELEGIVDDEVSPGRVRIGDASGGVLVTMLYDDLGEGVWAARVEQIAEDVPIPWAVSIRHHGDHRGTRTIGYSVVVEIDCPEGTPVKVNDDA